MTKTSVIWHILYNHIAMPLAIIALGLVIAPFVILVWIAAIVWCILFGWEDISEKAARNEQ